MRQIQRPGVQSAIAALAGALAGGAALRGVQRRGPIKDMLPSTPDIRPILAKMKAHIEKLQEQNQFQELADASCDLITIGKVFIDVMKYLEALALIVTTKDFMGIECLDSNYFGDMINREVNHMDREHGNSIYPWLEDRQKI